MFVTRFAPSPTGLLHQGHALGVGRGPQHQREFVAAELGFEGVCENSLDAVSDRDFALETLAAASITAGHLSRLAEEIVIWMTPMFGFVTLPDDLTTGSSIMPQKRNPDAAELVRAKTGRIVGTLDAPQTVQMEGVVHSRFVYESPLFN